MHHLTNKGANKSICDQYYQYNIYMIVCQNNKLQQNTKNGIHKHKLIKKTNKTELINVQNNNKHIYVSK